MKNETNATSTTPDPRCFRIIRFYRDSHRKRTIKTGLTEAQAQAHCQRDDTHGPGWFDGYNKDVKHS